jgi:hypothetical protein
MIDWRAVGNRNVDSMLLIILCISGTLRMASEEWGGVEMGGGGRVSLYI